MPPAIGTFDLGDALGLSHLRKSVAGAVRSLVGGTSQDSAAGATEGAASSFNMDDYTGPLGDPGLFGPDSVAWRVGSSAAMLIGGVRALLLQTVHPLAMAGVAEHSNYKTDPWGRLQRTATYVSATTYGSTAAANKTVKRVTAVHTRVHGTAPDGREYSALDPELLAWVHVTEIDSFATAVSRFGNIGLTENDIDSYHREMAVLGRKMGAAGLPESQAEVAAYYERMAPELSGSKQAREAVRFLLWPPVPPKLRPAYLAIVGAAVSLVPADVREQLWLPNIAFTEDLLIGPAGVAMTRFLGWALGESPVVSAAKARAAGVSNDAGEQAPQSAG